MTLRIDTTSLSDTLSGAAPKKNGAGGDFGALLKHAESKQSDAAAELEKYLQMTPEQRMAAAIMKQMGITPEQFAAMSPSEQAAVTAKIQQIIQQQLQEKMAQNQAHSTSLSGISL
ncbi:putative flavoprotein YhiN [Duganella sp. 1224]|uniref:hypothetical protein n=1 Tax=Duganella sp. 1224 TaxID=2587052 RepID=UPI0015CD4078|nr:hypothetical protein [Duganella sp. 1224]NYE63084.1 putative flavoprotein YhiN [Duganella sp. 1224]